MLFARMRCIDGMLVEVAMEKRGHEVMRVERALIAGPHLEEEKRAGER